MDKLQFVLFQIGQYNFALDAEEIGALLQFNHHSSILENGTGIFSQSVTIEKEELLLINLFEYYKTTATPLKPHLALLDMQETFLSFEEHRVINSTNSLFNHFAKLEVSLNKRFFSFIIEEPAAIIPISIEEIKQLPRLLRKNKYTNELWGVIEHESNAFILMDLKKFLITQICEVFS